MKLLSKHYVNFTTFPCNLIHLRKHMTVGLKKTKKPTKKQTNTKNNTPPPKKKENEKDDIKIHSLSKKTCRLHKQYRGTKCCIMRGSIIFFRGGVGGSEGYRCLLGKGEGIRGLFSVIFTL